MCDKEFSSYLVMFEIFDSLIMYIGILYGIYNKVQGDGVIFIYMYYGIELDKLECINKNFYRRREYFYLMGVLDSLQYCNLLVV